MDFRILGALEVWDGDERVEISGRLHPRILVGLLLNAGRTVSIEWLVDLLWDDDPPKTARRQVQNAVAALRRQLDLVRDGLIERLGSEYRINIDDDKLDHRRFDEAVREARRLAESERWIMATERFESALGLWRGAALAGFSGRVLEAAAARLDDKYLSTFEEYAHVATAAGKSASIVEKLRELVAAHPFRQRLTARLMEALYRSGRAQEALTLFEEVRTLLINELGIDPSADLISLRIRIVQDNVGDTQRSKPPKPAQLPTDVATFTGRTDQLKTLDQLLDSGTRASIVSAIAGIGGVGKTALAVHWGHTRREDFPDGQLYINLRGFDERKPLTPHEAVSRLLRSLGHPSKNVPHNLDEAASVYRSLMADKQMLVVLDNARTVDQVRPLLPECPGTLAIVTSRRRLSSLIESHNAHAVELDTLRLSESIDLLTELLGAEALVDVTITRQLAELCGHLPLALRILAANRIQNPDKTLAHLVSDLGGPSRLSRLNVDDDAATNLTAVFNLSYRTLSRDARFIFDYLSLFPGDDFGSEIVAAVSLANNNVVQEALHELAGNCLIDQHKVDRFRLHDLIRDFAINIASKRIPEQQRNDAISRTIDWYSHWPNLEQEEISNVLAVYDAYSNHDQSWKITSAFRRFATYGQELDSILYRTERAFDSTQSQQNATAEVTVLNALAILHTMRGSHAAGLDAIRRAADQLPQVKDLSLRGRTLGNLGILLYDGGSLPESIPHLRKSLSIAIDCNDRIGSISRSANLGRAYRMLGQYREAQEYLMRAIRIAIEEQLPIYVASANAALASVYLSVGRLQDSLTTAMKAVQLCTGTNSTRIVATASRVMGWTYRQMGELTASLDSLNRALTITQQEQRVGMQVEILNEIAQTYLSFNRVEQAHSFHSSANALLQPESNRSVVGSHEQTRCAILTSIGSFSQAIEHGLLSCDIFRHEIQSPPTLARSLSALGEAHLGNGDPAAAHDCWTEALAIATRLDVPEAATLRAKLAALPAAG